jgi:hypothetical protein
MPLNRGVWRFGRAKNPRAPLGSSVSGVMTPETQPAKARDFYWSVIDVLESSSIKFLVVGAFALSVHTGIDRGTKDFDLIIHPRDVERVLAAFRKAGFQAECTFSHWLAKVYRGPYFVDLVFRGGNGICEVDDEWFAAAGEAEVLGRKLCICPVEEMIWQKSFIMERERFDGADVLHMLRMCAQHLDWARLLRRYGADWRVLLSHLILFEFVYPGERSLIPRTVMDDLIARLAAENAAPPTESQVCRGTLLSREQYLPDVELWGYIDARREERVHVTEEELRIWTEAARKDAERRLKVEEKCHRAEATAPNPRPDNPRL